MTDLVYTPTSRMTIFNAVTRPRVLREKWDAATRTWVAISSRRPSRGWARHVRRMKARDRA